MFFKKTVVFFGILSALNLSIPRKSEAGVIFMFQANPPLALLGFQVVAIGGTTTLAGIWALLNNPGSRPPKIMIAIGAFLLMLSADGSKMESEIEEGLKLAVPEFKNGRVLANIAAYVKAQAEITPILNGKKEVRVSPEVVDQLIQMEDTTGKELAVQKLKEILG